MREGEDLLLRSIQSNVPANCFVVIDTHADTHTGELQWAGGTTAVQTASARELLACFCGERFLELMKAASNAARAFVPPVNPGWYNGSPCFRGGWRGLFVASCAPVVRVERGFEDLRNLVER
jgi:hypothetical protein